MLAVRAVWFEGWKTTFVVGYTQKLIRGFWYTITEYGVMRHY